MYHLSKVHDSHNIHFACRIWGLRATDLNQGVVYGIETEETALDDRLMTRFDYDEVFGTALNRFCLQAVIGHPLTVYGKGGQTRGYLNIVDTLQCVELAVLHPAGRRRVPGVQPVHRAVLGAASSPSWSRRRAPRSASTSTVEPRSRTRGSSWRSTTTTPTHTKLLDLGLKPHLLNETLIESMFSTIERFKDRVIAEHILPRDRWRPAR